MADKLIDGPRGSAFLESAAKLDAVARPGEQSAGVSFVPAADRMAAISPDEAWGRRFMSMAIGPDLAKPIPPQMVKPEPVSQAVLSARDEIVAETNVTRAFGKPEKPGPIGVAIGKPVRRSLLRRMFSRD